jgi:hypothetical protein
MGAWPDRTTSRRDAAINGRSFRPRRRELASRGCGVVGTVLILLGLWAANLDAATGQFRITVVDKDTHKPITCRMHLKSSRGVARKVPLVPSWADHFVVPGTLLLKLPLGGYTFEIERGLEYVTCFGNFTIENFADDSKEIELRRFIDMSEHGWWSGDLDVRRSPLEIEALMMAEDLHVVPLVTWWDKESHWTKKSPPNDRLVHFDRNRFYHLMAGNVSWSGGTLALFNLAQPQSQDDPRECPTVMELLEKLHGTPRGWCDATRPFWWDLPMLVAHGQVDAIQVAHGQLGRDRAVSNETDGKPRDTQFYPGAWGNARWSQDIYFRLLDCGLRLPPSAGSGSGVSPNPPGYNRVYVHLDSELRYEQWWDAFRAGRVTITNGPLLQPKVRGEFPGHVFHAEEGEKEQFEIGLTLSTRDPISYLEIIKDGLIEHSIPFREYSKIGRLPTVTFDHSGWFLVRATTEVQSTYRFAMTAPYYVEIGDQRRISKQAAKFFVDWVFERARQIQIADPDLRRRVLRYHREARDFWQGLLDKANAK